MSTRSRLSRKLEQRSEKSMLLSIMGILVVMFLLIKFGIPFIINATLFINGSKDREDQQEKDLKTLFISPPILDLLPNATNSAQIKISGTSSSSKSVISLYINDEVVDKTKTDDKKTFSFDSITLSKGNNIIKVKARDSNTDKESSFSNQYTVIFNNTVPNLTIDTPSDNQTFSKDNNKATVSGKTDPGVRVTVNDFWAIVDDLGKFSYDFPLQNGENKIRVAATDQAGNKKEAEIKVTYSP